MKYRTKVNKLYNNWKKCLYENE